MAAQRSASDYGAALRQLLPPGPALPRTPDSWLGRLLDALSAELARIDARAQQLIEELDPRTTLELLPDWERICGLPWCGGEVLATVPERRAAIMGRLTARGGQSIAYLTELAAQLGVVIVIEEFRPLRAGFRAGARCADPDWAFAFRVNVLAPGAVPDALAAGRSLGVIEFRAGASHAGDRLRSFGMSTLECVIGHARPAHSQVIFAYPPAPALAWSFAFTGA